MAPLLTLRPLHDGPWQCFACVKNYTQISPKPWADSKNNLFCGQCIHSQLEKALAFDFYMPATWGGEELHIDDYAFELLNADFVLAYSTAYFRKMARLAADASRPRDAKALAEEVPKEWELGRQYQRCPVCLKMVQLLADCNHITCPKPCGTDYCYICGKEVSVEGLRFHWKEGGCPHYFHPDDTNAVFAPGRGHANAEKAMEEQRERTRRMHQETLDRHTEKLHTSRLFAYTWNVAMQIADEDTRLIMQNVLRFLTLSEDIRPDAPALDDIDRVMTELIRYRPSHGVGHSEWVRTLIRSRLTLRHALTRPGELLTPYRPHDLIHPEPHPITSGVLKAPVGGVFNMADRAGRLAAYEWAGGRGMAWSDWRHQKNHYAVFVAGPQGSGPDRSNASFLMMRLQRAGGRWTRDRVRFVRDGMVGDAILVEILPEALVAVRLKRPLVEANPLYEIREWFLDPYNVVPPGW